MNYVSNLVFSHTSSGTEISMYKIDLYRRKMGEHCICNDMQIN